MATYAGLQPYVTEAATPRMQVLMATYSSDDATKFSVRAVDEESLEKLQRVSLKLAQDLVPGVQDVITGSPLVSRREIKVRTVATPPYHRRYTPSSPSLRPLIAVATPPYRRRYTPSSPSLHPLGMLHPLDQGAYRRAHCRRSRRGAAARAERRRQVRG